MKKLLLIVLLSAPFYSSADINIYGPGGPHAVLQEAARFFYQKEGIKVNVHFGPQLKWNEQAKKDADIIFGASEQSALAIIKDHSDRFDEKEIQPIYLRESILLVKKGNPKKISSIEDLTKDGVGIIVNDGAGTSNTSGTGVWEDIAGRQGNIDTVSGIRKNIIFFAPNSGTARDFFLNNQHADVWITWADWAISNPDIGDVVKISPEYTIWRDMNIAIRRNANHEILKFSKWLNSTEASEIFSQYGWIKKSDLN